MTKKFTLQLSTIALFFMLILSMVISPNYHIVLSILKFSPSRFQQKIIDHIDSPKVIKSFVQEHFRKYNVYIPMDDIIWISQVHKNNKLYWTILNNTCNYPDPLAVWVPFQLKIPILGKRFLEWCWTPKITI